MELINCPSLAVPPEVMRHVVRVESSYNPYAIGVVGGRLARQPASLPEALATVRMLERRGYDFSLGLAQVNRRNLGKYGIASYEQAFQPCANVQAGARILADCYQRSGNDWGKSFSCYYSGNFVTGYRDGYVQKIYASIRGAEPGAPGGIAVTPVEVVDTPARRSADVSRHSLPLRAQSGLQRVETAEASSLLPPATADMTSAQPDPAPLAPVAATALLQPAQAQPTGPIQTAAQDASPAIDSAFVF